MAGAELAEDADADCGARSLAVPNSSTRSPFTRFSSFHSAWGPFQAFKPAPRLPNRQDAVKHLHQEADRHVQLLQAEAGVCRVITLLVAQPGTPHLLWPPSRSFGFGLWGRRRRSRSLSTSHKPHWKRSSTARGHDHKNSRSLCQLRGVTLFRVKEIFSCENQQLHGHEHVSRICVPYMQSMQFSLANYRANKGTSRFDGQNG